MPELPPPELLAPAGNPSVALSAFDAGADAVYCGLRKFNARERSENFSHEELAKLIAYAHRSRRKVYVTFNTLLKESELDDAAREMAFLAECRPDAVIVQDLGAARMFREFFPQLTLHASTQLGIHNSAGLEMARRFGFRRVILERQVTIDELRKMIPDGHPPIEMELFIHGALCCCVSGSCLFSSWLGGWSGNRGKCKQPCRRRYFSESSPKGGFLFSPDDLCSLELLDDFRRLGICSLKIEGRLRRADYVEKVVRAYRLALDADPDSRADALAEAGRILSGAVTRKTSPGFYSTESMRKLIRSDSGGGSGILCGTVEKTVPGGFEARMTGRIHVGDTIRIQSETDTGDGLNMTVLYLEKDRGKVMKVQAGERCFIRSERKPDRGSLIYRTGEAGADLSARAAALPAPRIPLDLKIRLEEKRLTAEVGECDACFELDFAPLAAARTHAVSSGELEKAFSVAGSEWFEAGRISAETAGEWFVPAAVLKEWRRSFWTWAEGSVPHDLHRKTAADGLRRFREELKRLGEGPRPDPMPDCTAVAGSAHLPDDKLARDIGSAGPSDEIILPPFVPESRLDGLRREIGRLLASGAKVFRLTSFFQFALFPEPDRVTLKTMYPFPVSNSQSVLVCREAGASAVQAWIELGQGDCLDLIGHTVLPLEAYVSGRPCIFLTRASVPDRGGRIRDIRGNRFELYRQDGLSGLYPEQTVDIGTPAGYSAFRDERKPADSAAGSTDFNFSRGWA